ncbi:hypothetical protein ETB97_007353 [Aspergillus alliaceus]|uniref:Major facilitator superfamily (MFS) profile domain-containing protein n=1 Tax=Petromyces alliaceus TaxID=209559 RepID=A0A8H6A9Q7_PETAA|nr:hypothetical protein ETB97_007353 [Aspergillus burnettii]
MPVVLMIFLVACSVFEAPSNLAMKVSSSPVWLAFLVTGFGSLCAGIGGAKNVPTLMALRLLLGAVEAGVYPGMIFFLSFWYGPRERAIRIAVFLCSATLAGAFGGAIAYGVGHMNQVGDLPAWRWLFILEGAPCIHLAISILLFLPSYPEKAKWLTEKEEALLKTSFGENIPRGDDKPNWEDAKSTLAEARL